MEGFDVLGADLAEDQQAARNAIVRTVASLIAGALGAACFRSHPVLGFIGTSAVVGELANVAHKEKTSRQALRRLGQHAVAITGSLALPSHPVWGYIAGAVTSNMLIGEDDDGFAGWRTEWDKKEQPSKALVKQ